jgi:hypothetical protein
VWETEDQRMTAAPKYGSLLKLHCSGSFVRRTFFPWREADVLGEEMGTGTRGARRGMGPVAYTRIAEIMSGRSHFQQGLAATCEDSPYKEHEVGERGWDWRMSPYERRWKGNAFRQDARHLAIHGYTGDGQRGSGHSAVSWSQPISRHRTGVIRGCNAGRGGQQTMAAEGGCVPALEPLRPWEGWLLENGLQGRGQNRTREIRPSGIAGRLIGTRVMGVGLRPVRKLAELPPNPKAVAHYNSIPTSARPVPRGTLKPSHMVEYCDTPQIERAEQQ